MTTTYYDFNTNTEKVSLDTEYTTVAVKMSMYDADNPDITPEMLARIQFF